METSMRPPPITDKEREALSIRRESKPFRFKRSNKLIVYVVVPIILGVIIGVAGTIVVRTIVSSRNITHQK